MHFPNYKMSQVLSNFMLETKNSILLCSAQHILNVNLKSELDLTLHSWLLKSLQSANLPTGQNCMVLPVFVVLVYLDIGHVHANMPVYCIMWILQDSWILFSRYFLLFWGIRGKLGNYILEKHPIFTEKVSVLYCLFLETEVSGPKWK